MHEVTVSDRQQRWLYVENVISDDQSRCSEASQSREVGNVFIGSRPSEAPTRPVYLLLEMRSFK